MERPLSSFHCTVVIQHCFYLLASFLRLFSMARSTLQTIARCLSASATIGTIVATLLLVSAFVVDSWLVQTDVLEYTVTGATATYRGNLGLFNQCVECIDATCPDPALPANVKICLPVDSIQKCTGCPNGAFARASTFLYPPPARPRISLLTPLNGNTHASLHSGRCIRSSGVGSFSPYHRLRYRIRHLNGGSHQLRLVE